MNFSYGWHSHLIVTYVTFVSQSNKQKYSYVVNIFIPLFFCLFVWYLLDQLNILLFIHDFTFLYYFSVSKTTICRIYKMCYICSPSLYCPNFQYLKSDSKKFFVIFWNLLLFCYLPFKNDEECFLFHLKSSFRSQDI